MQHGLFCSDNNSVKAALFETLERPTGCACDSLEAIFESGSYHAWRPASASDLSRRHFLDAGSQFPVKIDAGQNEAGDRLGLKPS
jgi:hypothetical protein